MFTAMQNVVPSHLCDSNLFNFTDINSSSGVINGGDTAFDQEVFSQTKKTSNKNYAKTDQQLQVTEVK